MKTVKTVALGITINGHHLYVTPTGVKVTVRGKVEDTGSVLARVDKGTARRLRKALRRAGHHTKAAAPRPPLLGVAAANQ